MTSRLTLLFGTWLALNACQPEKSVSDAKSPEPAEENIRLIGDWHVAVIGSGEDLRLVEWPSMEPITTGLPNENDGWGFIVVGTKNGQRAFETPSLMPIRNLYKKPSVFDSKNFHPQPGSRWSK